MKRSGFSLFLQYSSLSLFSRPRLVLARRLTRIKRRAASTASSSTAAASVPEPQVPERIGKLEDFRLPEVRLKYHLISVVLRISAHSVRCGKARGRRSRPNCSTFSPQYTQQRPRQEGISRHPKSFVADAPCRNFRRHKKGFENNE